MNSFKKSAASLSHDSARRSSLPLGCFDTCFSEATFSDLAKKIKLSPIWPEKNSEKFHLPQIVVCDNTSSGINVLSDSPLLYKNQHELFPRASSPLIRNRLQTRRKSLNAVAGTSDFNVCLASRRASCGPDFPFGSSSPDLSVFASCRQCEPSQTLSNHVKRNNKTPAGDRHEIRKHKGPDESQSSRNQSSFLHLPSLSPCYEDKPKLNACQKTEEHYFSFKETRNIKEFDKSRERRASFHASVTPSPRFPHAGVFWCQDASLFKKNRRNSISNIPVSKLLEKEDQNCCKKESKNLYNATIPQEDQIIGKGGFGVVKVGIWKGEKVAVKILVGRKVSASIQCEKNALQLEPHPGIVETYAVITPNTREVAQLEHQTKAKDESILMSRLTHTFGISNSPTFSHRPNEGWTWIISELCTPLNLLKVINSSLALHDYDYVRILLQIAMALSHIHRSGFVHLDVKPSNCFLTPSGTVKLGDFGCLSKISEIPNRVIGTVAYQAPEVLKGEIATDRSDVFSFAISAWQLLTSETPYKGIHPHVIIYKVTRVHHRPSTDQPISKYTLMQKVLFTIIEKCWTHEPEGRPSGNSLCRILASLLYSAEQNA